ncbi:glycosyl transferase family 1 [Arthrobacter sp. SW1]|uniref:glycosyltransferase family 4 protein n=1 Tax=Arthrobacter sp. SW1 TaxID=1920889 RepID=UPI000877B197|nr:glycosyltransferase family 4 protein [Arthrobacter sp. SW1]OFI38952.1 glycosyl transferase family 1 [Arthrobacter sp. SW1]
MRNPQPRTSVVVAHPSADLYGSDRVLLETVDGLLRHGARVLVTVPGPGPLVPALQQRGVNVVYCPTPVLRKSFLSPMGLLRLAVAGVRGGFAGAGLLRGSRPDVLLANTITVPLWTVLARLFRIPVLTHVHEAESSASPALRAALALPLLLSTDIVTNSTFSAETLGASLPRLRGRATVVWNGVPGPAAVVPARKSLDGGLNIAYLGRLSHRKGVDVAVDAVVQLRARGISASLALVGAVFPGNEAYEEQLRTQVAQAGAADFVTFHGFQQDVWPYLAAADVAVVPSRLDEPFGNTAVEALLAARPVVASNTSGLREAAGGYGASCFVEPGNATALAEALTGIRESWPRYRELAEADAIRARERHSPAAYGDNMARQVSDVAARGSGKRDGNS